MQGHVLMFQDQAVVFTMYFVYQSIYKSRHTVELGQRALIRTIWSSSTSFVYGKDQIISKSRQPVFNTNGLTRQIFNGRIYTMTQTLQVNTCQLQQWWSLPFVS